MDRSKHLVPTWRPHLIYALGHGVVHRATEDKGELLESWTKRVLVHLDELDLVPKFTLELEELVQLVPEFIGTEPAASSTPPLG
jgi:hypothetical protein